MRIGEAKSPYEVAWLEKLWDDEWGGRVMVSRGKSYHLHSLTSFLAYDDNMLPVGAITITCHEKQAEIMSLNALVEGQGIGTGLLIKAEHYVASQGIRQMVLITSNDNIRALAFYQKRGYRLSALYPGAVDEARVVKPSIPLLAKNGIPIHDEIELEKFLG